VDVAHLVAVAGAALAAAVLAFMVRRWPRTRGIVRGGLVVVLLGGATAYLAAEAIAGELSVWDFLPLHLCDFAIFVAAFSGVFPEWRWLVYFTMHGAVVVSAVVLVVGFRIRPQPGAPGRVFGWTLLYAAIVGVVDWTFGANFLYLRAKPAEPTPLDWFGPWPLYLVIAALIGLTLFHLLMFPFRPRHPTKSARRA
jgi:uncharacterized membrane protein YwaF